MNRNVKKWFPNRLNLKYLPLLSMFFSQFTPFKCYKIINLLLYQVVSKGRLQPLLAVSVALVTGQGWTQIYLWHCMAYVVLVCCKVYQNQTKTLLILLFSWNCHILQYTETKKITEISFSDPLFLVDNAREVTLIHFCPLTH